MSSAEITLRAKACPRDGTILESGMHSTGDGRYECPKCQTRWEAHEVAQR